MKNAFALLAAAALGTVALAQTPPTAPTDMGAQTTPPAAPMTPGDPAPSMPPAPPATAADPGAPMPPTAADPTPMASDNTAPAAAPATTAAPVDTSNYPRCSRTVTDKCVQGGAARRRR